MSDIPPKKNDLEKVASLIGIIVLVILGLYILNFSPFIPDAIKGLLRGFSDNRGDWGTFGDYVGGTLNPLFGFFGFIALLVTLSLQRQQLDEQRKDMEEQRKEIALSNKTQIKQQFEGSFFELLAELDQEFPTKQPSTDNVTTMATPTQTRWINLVNVYKHCLSGFVVGKYAEHLLKVYLEVCDFYRKVYGYFKILRISIISIDRIVYPNLQQQTIADKNFYVDLLLAKQGKEKILALVLPYINQYIDLSIYLSSEPQKLDREEPIDFINCKSLLDPSLQSIISRLGLLRELDFSPFNNKIFEATLGLTYAQHPITLALVETFGEQAFKPIEAPPFNT